MCGIVGFIDVNNKIISPRDTLTKMCKGLSHRGPDDMGMWHDEKEAIFLGHLRLSILDLTSAACQPMMSSTGRYVIVFNGEIYNYLDIKKELLALNFSFKTSSDTEVIVNAIEAWGLNKTLEKLIGMFAFGIWDKLERKIFLARDRVGEKPLYYGYTNGIFFFCSELKAIKGISYFKPEIDESAVADFFKFSYVPAPKSIFKQVYKLLPASFIEITPEQIRGSNTLSIEEKPYWNYNIEQGYKFRSIGEAADELDSILRKVISQQMLADVPLGAFLSGGIDSSLIVSFMKAISRERVHTFSVGFEDERYNEAPYAKEIARHLNCIHHEYIFTNQDLEELITTIPTRFDEPFGDSSQIPTYIVARFAKSEVSVSLSGDGGDEIFGGYTKYLRGQNLHQKLNRIPKGIAKVLGMPLSLLSPMLANSAAKKIDNLLRMGDIHDEAELYGILSQNYVTPELLSFCNSQIHNILPDAGLNTPLQEKFMYWDFKTYLPDDILVKVDRMAMAVSLETRAPFLDKRIIEFMASIDLNYKINDQQLKVLPKLLLKKYVPEALFNRPKRGFSVPLKSWFMSRDNKFIDHVFNDIGKKDKYVNNNYALKLLEKHRRSQINASTMLWNIYVWYLWSQSIE